MTDSLVTPPQTASVVHTVTVAPFAGVAVNRYDGASIAVSQTAFPAAALKNGPLLLTGTGSLNPSAVDALHADADAADGGIAAVSLFGGSSVLPPTVQSDVAAAVAPATTVYADHHVMF